MEGNHCHRTSIFRVNLESQQKPMNILIVEDEYPTAEYTQQLCQEILGDELSSITMVHDLAGALEHVDQHAVDLCLLDLNLHGENGYELLQTAAAQSFHTVIISAYPDQALEAFQYGVLDFIAKPFGKGRLQEVLIRVLERTRNDDVSTKYLSVRTNEKYQLVKIKNIMYIKSVGPYVELHFKDGNMELLLKTMNRLEQILPAYLFRTHRSYFVNLNEIESFCHASGGKYELTLKTGMLLPLSRSKYKSLYGLFHD
jgi:two-component system, LytTR family, response regulator